jgi:hypothetical protein
MKMPIGTFEPRDLAVLVCSEYGIDIMADCDFANGNAVIWARAAMLMTPNQPVVLQSALITLMHFYELSILQESDIDESLGDLPYDETVANQLTRLYSDYNKLVKLYYFLKITEE